MYLFSGHEQRYGILVGPQALDVRKVVGMLPAEHGFVDKLFFADDADGLVLPAQQQRHAQPQAQHRKHNSRNRVGDSGINSAGRAACQEHQRHSQRPLRQVHIRPMLPLRMGHAQNLFHDFHKNTQFHKPFAPFLFLSL